MKQFSTYSKEIWLRVTIRLLEVIKSRAESSQQVSEALPLCSTTRIFKVDIDTIKAVVLDKLNGAVHEGGSLASIGDEVEVAGLGVRPSADGEQDLEVPTYGKGRFSIGERGAAASLSDLWLSLRR